MPNYKKHTNKSFTVRDMPMSERPRERLHAIGPDKLSAGELLAIILSSGSRGEPVTVLAQRLLGHFNNQLSRIADATVEELTMINGVGPAKAAQVKAALELGRRLMTPDIQNIDIVKDPGRVVDYIYPKLRDMKKEYFYVLPVNSRNMVIRDVEATKGGLTSSIVEPRVVFKDALAANAAAVIVAHNHPSGDPTPSGDDIAITKRLAEAGRIVGVEVLDHIIIGNPANNSNRKKYFSFKEERLL